MWDGPVVPYEAVASSRRATGTLRSPPSAFLGIRTLHSTSKPTSRSSTTPGFTSVTYTA